MNEHYDFEYLIKRDAINAAKGHAQVISIKWILNIEYLTTTFSPNQGCDTLNNTLNANPVISIISYNRHNRFGCVARCLSNQRISRLDHKQKRFWIDLHLFYFDDEFVVMMMLFWWCLSSRRFYLFQLPKRPNSSSTFSSPKLLWHKVIFNKTTRLLYRRWAYAKAVQMVN